MDPRDIDPNLYQPLFRTIFRSFFRLSRSPFKKLLASRSRARSSRNKRRVKRWWVVEDPSGNALCVIRPQSDAWPRNANRRESGGGPAK